MAIEGVLMLLAVLSFVLGLVASQLTRWKPNLGGIGVLVFGDDSMRHGFRQGAAAILLKAHIGMRAPLTFHVIRLTLRKSPA